MDDLSKHIGVGHPAGLCPLCDNAMEDWENCEAVKSHGTQMLAHIACVDEARTEDNRDDGDEEEGEDE